MSLTLTPTLPSKGYRRGQTKTVHIYRLLTKSTMETKIANLASSKVAMVAKLMGIKNDDNFVTCMSPSSSSAASDGPSDALAAQLLARD